MSEIGLTSAIDAGGRDSVNYFEFRSVSKAFDERPVLNQVSFAVKRGDTCVIMGRSGVGKSVALKSVYREAGQGIGSGRRAG